MITIFSLQKHYERSIVSENYQGEIWVEALSTVVYLVNRLPSQVLAFDAHFFLHYGIQPTYHALHTFGCLCFVHLPLERQKLGAQSAHYAFLGYAPTQKGFLCNDASAHRLVNYQNMVFFYH